jgi:anti-sigma-K factor RskA
MSTAYDIDDDDRWLAAEHALGVLDGARRAEAERRVEADAAFRAEVEGWTAHLAPLLLSSSPAQPSPAVWAAVQSRLDAEHGSAVRPRPRRARRLWNDVRLWRATTAGALALAAASWLVTVTPRTGAPTAPAIERTPVLAASLAAQAGEPLFTVMVDRDRGQVAVVPLYPWTPDRSRELWLIPADGIPRSLGLIERGHPAPLRLPPELGAHARASVTFAVSDEPAGGSPLEGPSGPVLATGALEAL